MIQSFTTIPNTNPDLVLVEIAYLGDGTNDEHEISELDIVGWRISTDETMASSPEPIAVGWSDDVSNCMWGVFNKVRGTVSADAFAHPVTLERWIADSLSRLRGREAKHRAKQEMRYVG